MSSHPLLCLQKCEAADGMQRRGRTRGSTFQHITTQMCFILKNRDVFSVCYGLINHRDDFRCDILFLSPRKMDENKHTVMVPSFEFFPVFCFPSCFLHQPDFSPHTCLLCQLNCYLSSSAVCFASTPARRLCRERFPLHCFVPVFSCFPPSPPSLPPTPPSTCTSSPALLFSHCLVICWVSTMLLPVRLIFLLLWPKIKLHPLHSLLHLLCFDVTGCNYLPTTALLMWTSTPLCLSYLIMTLAVSQFRVCILQRSIWRPITSQCHATAVPIWRLLQMLVLFPDFGGCTAVILLPRYLCAPKKEERKREDGNIAWHGSSFSRAWVTEIVM